MNISIRRATPDDSMTLVRLNRFVHEPHAQILPHRYKPYDESNPEMKVFYDKHLADESTYAFIAEDAGKPVGYVLCVINEGADNPFVYASRAFHIDQMAVNSDYQSHGVGGQLMEKVLSTAKDLKVDRVTLGVMAFNERAIKFYERCGFEMGSHRMTQSVEHD